MKNIPAGCMRQQCGQADAVAPPPEMQAVWQFTGFFDSFFFGHQVSIYELNN